MSMRALLFLGIQDARTCNEDSEMTNATISGEMRTFPHTLLMSALVSM